MKVHEPREARILPVGHMIRDPVGSYRDSFSDWVFYITTSFRALAKSVPLFFNTSLQPSVLPVRIPVKGME